MIYDMMEINEDNIYSIDKSRISVFLLFLKPNSILDIGLTYTNKDNQDLALKCWISNKPIENVINVENLKYFSISRFGTKISLLTSDQTKPNNISYILPSGIYYLNIQNLENVRNNYFATFSYT